ncbi:MAG: hypothetical protein ACSLEY_01550 [Candidatus Saccharimonadales bacterium]
MANHKPKPIPPYRIILTNTFGILGYVSCLMQWFWLMIVFLPAIIASGLLEFLLPQESTNQAPSFTFHPSPFVITIVLIITAFIIALGFVAILRLPGEIGRAGKHITHSPATAAFPILTHHKKVSTKKKLEITYRITLMIKLLLILVPFVGLLFSYFVSVDIPHELVLIIGGLCALMSLLWFSVQSGVAYLWRAPSDKLI